MGSKRRAWRTRALTWMCAGGFLLQFGGCNFGEITTTVSLSSRDLLINLFRGIILTPVDTAITNAINQAFPENV